MSIRIGNLSTARAAPYYFDQWKTDGTLERINTALNQLDRKQEEREAVPSVFCIDRQSVKLAPLICKYRDLDPHKKVNGRERQLLVDISGRSQAVMYMKLMTLVALPPWFW